MERSMTDASQPHPFEVYFDGSCPMCIREIDFYRKRKGADAITWIDVSEGHFCSIDLSCTEAMARFHIRKQSGELVDGGRAFAELWKQLPGFRWLGKLCTLPGIAWLMDRAYDLFLPMRPHLQRFFRRGEY